MKTASCLIETLLDPVTGFSQEPTEAAFQRGNRTHLPCYEWLEQPENITSLRKFPNAMRATTHYNSDKAVNEGVCRAGLWLEHVGLTWGGCQGSSGRSCPRGALSWTSRAGSAT